MKKDIPPLLHVYGLRDTQPRRLVLSVLQRAKTPLSHKKIFTEIKKSNAAINLVTIYRVLEKFEEIGLTHRHLHSGGVVLCTLQDTKGHHVLLSCSSCGTVKECADPHLCQHEDRIAKKAGFTPKAHCSEVIGMCSSCH